MDMIDGQIQPEWLAFGEIVRIRLKDGHVEVNPKYAVEDAARAFWDTVKRLAPSLQEKTPEA